MMLLDESIRLMIGMTDDKLRKIKNFILTKLSIKNPKVFMPTTSNITFKSTHSIETWSNYISSML